MSLFRLQPLLSPAIRPLPSRLYATDWRARLASKWNSDEEIERAREWLASFRVCDIPKKSCTIAYSASSGPGGQNVNKLATKATLHLDLNKDVGFLPDFAVRKVRENSRHLTRNEEIVIQADGARGQRDNMEDAYHRLHKILVECVSVDVPGVTDAEKKQRVKELYRLPSPASPPSSRPKVPQLTRRSQKQDDRLRRKLKTIQKSKKDSRRSRPGDD